jgi:radical SAM family RiPP maturation amino acid epimerase
MWSQTMTQQCCDLEAVPDLRGAHWDMAIRLIPAGLNARELSTLAQTKRLIDWIFLDLEARARLLKNPMIARHELGVDVDVDTLRPLWEQSGGVDGGDTAPALRHFQAFVEARKALRQRMRAGSVPLHPTWAQWRQRQMHRCWLELPPATHDAIAHIPVAIELNRGCSVGCWFCGVAAGPLVERARYAEHKTLWREMLEVLARLCGPAAGYGFLYWSTEPLDNPDYEVFALDYAQAFGRFPMTTTAVPVRDPGRTRALLSLSLEHGCELNRFSILSRRLLQRVFDTFTPEELLHVDCLPLNKESGYSVSYAGRARIRQPKGRRVNDPREASTIACVSGCLINLVERRVQLITPCNASDRWPLGYWTVAEATFRDGDTLYASMRRMLEALAIRVPIDRPLRFHSDLSWSRTVTGTQLNGTWRRIALEEGYVYERIGEALACNHVGRDLDQAAFALQLEKAHGIPLAMTFFVLQRWFESGLLDDEPKCTFGEPRLQPGQVEASMKEQVPLR